MKIVSFILLSCFSVYGQWITGFYDAQNGVLSPSQVPWSKYTHVIHFAAAPNSDGTVDLHYLVPSEIAQLVAARPAGKKVLFCLKDNDGDTNAFPAATSPGEIATFVSNLVAFTNQYGYDGIDIDWEANTDVGQYSDLIARLRVAMPGKVITMDGGNWGGLESVAANSASSLDQVNVMCYDMDSASNGYSWYDDALYQAGNSQLLTCDWRMRSFTAAGVPASKLGIGIPFYGRRWSGVTQALVNGSFSPSTFLYRDLAVDGSRFQTQYMNYDGTYKANYLSIPNLGEFDSYVGPEHLHDTVAWQRSAGFGGFMTFTMDYEFIAGRSGDAATPLSAALANEVFGSGGAVASSPAPSAPSAPSSTPAPAPAPAPVPVAAPVPAPAPAPVPHAPVVLSANPQGIMSTPMYSTPMTVVTDVAGTCRYATTPGVAYSDMQGMFMDQGTTHVTTLNGLNSGPNDFYIRCQDGSGNTSSVDFFTYLNLP
jgi:hypothetical protein